MPNSINDKAVCRTAPATPGLLKSLWSHKQREHFKLLLRDSLQEAIDLLWIQT